MPTLPKLPPSSLRPDQLPPAARTVSAPENRPYLISALRRREVFSDGMRTLTTERSATLFAHESEDARLTGSTRSLFRRLLALNLPVDVTVGKPSASAAKKFPSRSASA